MSLNEDFSKKIDPYKLERHTIKEGCCVYYLFRGIEIVYIGSTYNLNCRLSSHSKTKDFDSYSFTSVREWNQFDLEAREILKYKPIFNKSLPSSLYWSQSKSKSNNVYARYFKESCRVHGSVVFLGTVYVESKYLVEFIGAEL